MHEVKTKPIFSETRFDPAPSKLAYLAHRVWLRKSSRLCLFILIPLLVIFFAFIGLGNSLTFDHILKKSSDKVAQYVAFSPIFRISNVSVLSEDLNVIKKIKSTIALNFPISSLSIDVDVLKKQVESIDLIKSASVRLTSSGLLEIDVDIRKPIAIQRIGSQFILIDSRGIKVDEVMSRSQRLDLPLLVGKGAENFVEEALFLLLETKTLIPRVRGLVRVGERRWDVVLNREQVISLPEKNPLKAMRNIISLQEGRQILDRNISYLDFRNINRPILGLTEDTSKELRDLRSFVRGENV